MSSDSREAWPFLSSLLEDEKRPKSSSSSGGSRSRSTTERTNVSEASSTNEGRDLASGRRSRQEVQSSFEQSGSSRQQKYGYSTLPAKTSSYQVRETKHNAVDLMRDDFDERMNEIVESFNQNLSRSLWDDDPWSDPFFSRGHRLDDGRFKGRSLLSDSFFSNTLPRTSSKRLEDEGFSELERNQRWGLKGFDDEDSSGSFSRGTSVTRHMQLEKSSSSDKFQVEINVKGFQANELTVKTEGRRVVVRAKSKDESENPKPSFVSRELKREFDLPESIDPYDVVSNLMPDGFLRIEAPAKEKLLPI